MNKNITEVIEIINNTENIITGGWKNKTQKIELVASPKDSLEKITTEISQCQLCGLCKTRNKPVPGKGTEKPDIMLIGEAPGGEEDKTGIPFVGNAGQYLDKWLSAIELNRNKDCFISNIIKCRPQNNRDPLPEEIQACKKYLMRQIKILKPRLILTLGRFAAQFICQSQEGIGKIRGKVYYYKKIPVVPTYHPSAVLRNPSLRKNVWSDLKIAKEILNELHKNSL